MGHPSQCSRLVACRTDRHAPVWSIQRPTPTSGAGWVSGAPRVIVGDPRPEFRSFAGLLYGGSARAGRSRPPSPFQRGVRSRHRRRRGPDIGAPRVVMRTLARSARFNRVSATSFPLDAAVLAGSALYCAGLCRRVEARTVWGPDHAFASGPTRLVRAPDDAAFTYDHPRSPTLCTGRSNRRVARKVTGWPPRSRRSVRRLLRPRWRPSRWRGSRARRRRGR